MSPTPPRPDLPDLAPSVQQEVARLAAAPEVRSAFNWFRTQEPQLAHWQMEMARIPAPPFGESARGAWLAERVVDGGAGQPSNRLGNSLCLFLGCRFVKSSLVDGNQPV